MNRYESEGDIEGVKKPRGRRGLAGAFCSAEDVRSTRIVGGAVRSIV